MPDKRVQYHPPEKTVFGLFIKGVMVLFFSILILIFVLSFKFVIYIWLEDVKRRDYFNAEREVFHSRVLENLEKRVGYNPQNTLLSYKRREE